MPMRRLGHTGPFNLSDSGQIFAHNSQAGDYTTTVDDYFVGITNTAAPRTVTLLDASRAVGRTVIVYDASGGAAGNNITVDGEGAAVEVNGNVAGVAIAANYGALMVVSDGTNWFSIS